MPVLVYEFNTRSELDTAVDLWITDEESATVTYGNINYWDVSAITDFSWLFSDNQFSYTFNSDISNWDVSNGSSFYGMFRDASSFDQDIGEWDVDNGTNFFIIFLNSLLSTFENNNSLISNEVNLYIKK